MTESMADSDDVNVPLRCDTFIGPIGTQISLYPDTAQQEPAREDYRLEELGRLGLRKQKVQNAPAVAKTETGGQRNGLSSAWPRRRANVTTGLRPRLDNGEIVLIYTRQLLEALQH